MWMTIWTVTIAMALGFSVLATLLKGGATFVGISANNPKRTVRAYSRSGIDLERTHNNMAAKSKTRLH